MLQAQKLHALKQEDDPETKNDLDGRMKNVVVNKEALEGTQAEIARNIPAYNASATTPQEVYPLDKIILKGEWSFLEDLYFRLRETAEINATYPSFVRNRIYKLQDIQVRCQEGSGCNCLYEYSEIKYSSFLIHIHESCGWPILFVKYHASFVG